MLPRGLESLAPLVRERLAPSAHGNMLRWLEALSELPKVPVESVRLDDTVTVDGPITAEQQYRLERCLMALHPWRKGPFRLFDIAIDAEWRSDWKWRRVAPHLTPLTGRRVLDVGCGNGYFGWRMLGLGAAEVVGVDPTLVFCLQHAAINQYISRRDNHVLPVRFEELPPEVEFDAVFSMGVIYHRRDPAEHVARLLRHTRPGGQVLVESLVVHGPAALEPLGRYARMRNIHIVPTPALLEEWLADAGFTEVRLMDVTPTILAEQRSTKWMRFQSLAQSLDPENPERTVEGHPAPLRAVVVGCKPV